MIDFNTAAVATIMAFIAVQTRNSNLLFFLAGLAGVTGAACYAGIASWTGFQTANEACYLLGIAIGLAAAGLILRQS